MWSLRTHLRRAHLRLVAEQADARRRHLAGVRVKRYLTVHRQARHIIAQRERLPRAVVSVSVIKENAFLRPQPGQKRQVAFTVLDAELPGRVALIKARRPLRRTALV